MIINAIHGAKAISMSDIPLSKKRVLSLRLSKKGLLFNVTASIRPCSHFPSIQAESATAQSYPAHSSAWFPGPWPLPPDSFSRPLPMAGENLPQICGIISARMTRLCHKLDGSRNRNCQSCSLRSRSNWVQYSLPKAYIVHLVFLASGLSALSEQPSPDNSSL